MAVNKVIYNNETLIDLSADTVTADKMLSGVTAHDKTGNSISGSLTVNNIYLGSTEPASDLGNNRDVFFYQGANAYKKVNGSWILQNDLKTAFEDNVLYAWAPLPTTKLTDENGNYLTDETGNVLIE